MTPIPSWLSRPGRVLMAVLVLLLSGCVSLLVTDTVPLSPDQMEPLSAGGISRGGYRLGDLQGTDQAGDLIVLVAISGGGKRSAAFGYGVLRGLREVTVDTPRGRRPLLQEVSVISGISGGSITAAYYGLYGDETFGRFEKDFLYQDFNSYVYGIYLFPWNWTWLIDPEVGTNDFMERVYSKTMFHDATFADLISRRPPVIAIGATDLNFGSPLLFTQEFFDLFCADLSRFPLARAVAASAGLPGLFSPITLTSRADQCGGRRPLWARYVTDAQRRDPLSRIGAQANVMQRYLDPGRTRYLHLADGGISDNLGLRAAAGMLQTAAQSADAVTSRGYQHVRRILVISANGQGAQDASLGQRKWVGGLLSILDLVSGAQIDRYNFETMVAVSEQLPLVAQGIARARCKQARAIDGAPCGDVEAALIHVGPIDMEDGPLKTHLLSVPTSLTLPPEDVDQLVASGRSQIVGSAELRRFLDHYPIGRAGPGPRAQSAAHAP